MRLLDPPSTDIKTYVKESKLCLENISACAVVRNERKCHLVSNTPSHLHKILWRAYHMDEFYSHENGIHERPEAKSAFSWIARTIAPLALQRRGIHDHLMNKKNLIQTRRVG